MNVSLVLRPAAFAALLSTALSASADDAFSNLGSSISGSGYIGGGFQQQIGYRFMSGLTGSLTGFRIAINNLQATQGAQLPFQVSLYSNNSSETLGTLLGTYASLSSGEYPGNSLVDVTATGLSLSAGTQYWIVASSSSSVAWNYIDGGTDLPGYSLGNGSAS